MARQNLHSRLDAALVDVSRLTTAIEQGNSAHQTEIVTLTANHQAAVVTLNGAHDSEVATLKGAHEAEVTLLKTTQETAERKHLAEKSALEAKLQILQDKNNTLELKKFASAFEKQEGLYKLDAEKWFRYSWITALFVLVATAHAINQTLQVVRESWHYGFGYYLLDVILITLLIFVLKQYSYYVRLATDYGNRKTLAQSYFNIVDSADVDDENEIIKTQFLARVSSILAAPAEVTVESLTLFEKIVDVGKELYSSTKDLKDKLPSTGA